MDVEIRDKESIKLYTVSKSKQSFKRVCLRYDNGEYKAVQRMKPLFTRCHKYMIVKLTTKAEIIENEESREETLTKYHKSKYYLKYTIHNCPEDKDIGEYYEELKEQSNELLEKNPSLNILKYGVRQTALHFFTMFNMLIDSPPEITEQEAIFINGATRGGIQYYEKGEYDEFITYDIHSHYPSIMSSMALLPYGNAIYKKIEDKEIKKSNNIGIYKCKVSIGSCDKKIFSMLKVYENELTYYTFTDVNMFYNNGCIIEMADEEYNFMTYDKYIQGKTIFKQFVDLFYNLKQSCSLGKEVLNSLWGKLCSSKKKIITSGETMNIDNYNIDRVEMDDNLEFIYHLQPKVPFKYTFGRFKAFLLGYGRSRLMKKVSKTNLQHIVRAHTDSLTFKKKLKFKVSSCIGSFDIERQNKEGEKMIIKGQNEIVIMKGDKVIEMKGRKCSML